MRTRMLVALFTLLPAGLFLAPVALADVPPPGFYFSVDIGSDLETMDPVTPGNLDPGDVYDPRLTPVKDDAQLFGGDPPPPGGPGVTQPYAAGIEEDVFDLDGDDQLAMPLDMEQLEFPYATVAFGGLRLNPSNLYYSLDDDGAAGWYAPRPGATGDVPVTSGPDLSVEVYVRTGWAVWPAPSVPVADEVAMGLGPAPPGRENDDDVDALDREYRRYWYWSCDHEATFSGAQNDPADIYAFDRNPALPGAFKAVDNTLLGVPDGTDVDAFEFIVTDDDVVLAAFQVAAGTYLALLFSVDEDDPLTQADESGGLDPKVVYISLMTRAHLALVELEGDVDALTVDSAHDEWVEVDKFEKSIGQLLVEVPGPPITPSPDLPPIGGVYSDIGQSHHWFFGADITVLFHLLSRRPLGDPPPILTTMGPDQKQSYEALAYGTAEVTDPSAGWFGEVVPLELTGPVETIARGKAGQGTGTFDTEMVSMSLAGMVEMPDGTQLPLEIRENPTLSSTGKVSITDLGGGLYHIDSFFDVFTELSVDGGANWIPVENRVRETLGAAPQLVPLAGPAEVNVLFEGAEGDAGDDTGNGLDEVDTELVAMDLRGNGPMGPMRATVSPVIPSVGLIEEGADLTTGRLDMEPFESPTGPADSFFDVWVEIDMGGNRYSTFEPFMLETPIRHKPPRDGERYRSRYISRKELIDDATGGGTGIYVLREVHQPDPTTEEDRFTGSTMRLALIRDMYGGGGAGMATKHLVNGTCGIDVHFEGDHQGAAEDDDFDGKEEVVAELVSMDLTGEGGLRVRVRDASEPPHTPSLGQMSERSNGTLGELDVSPFGQGHVDSFFDVFFEIELPGGKMYNATPLRIAGAHTNKPPSEGEGYAGKEPVALLDTNGVPTTWLLDVEFFSPDGEQDFGDAPDAPYPTLLPDGARHTLSPDVRLGATIDGEPDGQPDAHATGDDTGDGSDDEDGVFLSPLVPGRTTDVEVAVYGGGFLSVWVDFNGTNGWTDASDTVLLAQPVGAGLFQFGLAVPTNVAVGATMARFRISTQPDAVLRPDGAAPDGEVEDYEVWIEPDVEHKMHYPQFPDRHGADVMATPPKILADDFRCTSNGPITEIVFWGSWERDQVGEIENVHLSIHADDRSGLYSKPGELLWEWDTPLTRPPVEEEPSLQAWYDPNTGDYIPDNHMLYYRYTIDVPPDMAYTQTLGNIYWLDIQVTTDSGLWGWKTSRSPHFEDDAVWADWVPGGGAPEWFELRDPQTQESLDLAFYINGVPATEPPTQDWGDAPQPSYPVTAANQGANHLIVPGLYLGAGVDGDPDGQPSPHADGDDTDGGDDEDGVTFTSPLVVGETVTVDVVASASSTLDAFIDFDADGSWTGANEQVFISAALAGATNNLVFTVPAGAALGTTFARFRLSRTGGLRPAGAAPDGEVEDYEVFIVPRVVVNEVDYDQLSTDTNEYVELYNAGSASVDLDPLELWLINGTGGGASDYSKFGLPSFVLAPGAYYVISANASNVPNTDLDVTPDTNLIQNGAPDAVALMLESNVVDTVSYQGDTGAPYTEGSGSGLADDPNAGDVGIARVVDGVDTDQNNVDFSQSDITPGRPNMPMDYGDAPVPGYPTTYTTNGARHVLGGPFLGSPSDAPDAELDGQPDSSASGDDTDGNDDENGVAISVLAIRSTQNIPVIVSGGPGVLDAWVDFNGDGTFDDGSERVYGAALPVGTNAVAIHTPRWSTPGPTFARFRISSQGGLKPFGPADDGEVEDYLVELAAPPECPKWIQPIDCEYGLDLQSWGQFDPFDQDPDVALYSVADDWLCDGRPVTAIRWWGSFIGYEGDPIDPVTDWPPIGFRLSWFTDVPVENSPTNYSLPGVMLTNVFAYLMPYGTERAGPLEVQWEYTCTTPLDWMVPPPSFAPFEHEYEFYVELETPWMEKEGRVYWLAIEAVYHPMGEISSTPWGWKTTHPRWNWNDDAVLSDRGLYPPDELTYPPQIWPWGDIANHPYAGKSVNMAFKMLTDVCPRRCKKWAQPPDMELGMDRETWERDGAAPGDAYALRADDFISDGRPITDVHWWGSYEGWMTFQGGSETNPMPPPSLAFRPLGFKLSWHLEDPGDPCLPGPAITNVFVPLRKCHEMYFGTVFQFWNDPGHEYEHEYQYYVDLLDPAVSGRPWFEEAGVHYWLNIQAVFPTDFDPQEPGTPHRGWGWKIASEDVSSPCYSVLSTRNGLAGSWAADALPVILDYPRSGQPFDLAFDLTTTNIPPTNGWAAVTDLSFIDVDAELPPGEFYMWSTGYCGCGKLVLEGTTNLLTGTWIDLDTNPVPRDVNIWLDSGMTEHEAYRIRQTQ